MLRRTAILLHTASLARALTTTSPLFAASAAKKLRPSKDDVDRISWGKPSKKKGVGSRGTPHRLNEAERAERPRVAQRARAGGLLASRFSGAPRDRAPPARALASAVR